MSLFQAIITQTDRCFAGGMQGTHRAFDTYPTIKVSQALPTNYFPENSDFRFFITLLYSGRPSPFSFPGHPKLLFCTSLCVSSRGRRFPVASEWDAPGFDSSIINPSASIWDDQSNCTKQRFLTSPKRGGGRGWVVDPTLKLHPGHWGLCPVDPDTTGHWLQPLSSQLSAF